MGYMIPFPKGESTLTIEQKGNKVCLSSVYMLLIYSPGNFMHIT